MAKLPRLQRKTPVVDRTGLPSLQFQRDFDKFATTIEGQIAQINANVAAIAAAQAAAAAAQATATAAAATATTASATATTASATATTAASSAATSAATADAARVAAVLGNSGVTGVVLTGYDAGGSGGGITITAHTRIYGDGTSVAVNSGSLLSLAYSSLYFVYYDDAARAGGAVTYAATTSQTTATQTGNRHLVGRVFTPPLGGINDIGNYVGVAGVGSLYA